MTAFAVWQGISILNRMTRVLYQQIIENVFVFVVLRLI